MMHDTGNILDRGLIAENPARVAIVGGGIAGLTCARELCLRGYDPVVFESEDRLGGRCSSLSTRVGLFDDGAQGITGATRLAVHVAQPPGVLAALHDWTIPASPAEEERRRKGRFNDDDEEDVTRTLKPLGVVGVPSMSALADALARPIDIRRNTRITQARRRDTGWLLSSANGEIAEEFQALVLAIPAPLAAPLAVESATLSEALRAVRYRSRWVLLLGTERPVTLPGYREFQGSPIERVAAMHSKPGRPITGPQRWFVEADQRWSLQHEHEDAETVAELMFDNFVACAGRPVTPNFLRAKQWRHAFVETPVTQPGRSDCWWDERTRLGVCGDSVVASQVDRVHRSGVEMARALAEGLGSRGARYDISAVDRARNPLLEVHL